MDRRYKRFTLLNGRRLVLLLAFSLALSWQSTSVLAVNPGTIVNYAGNGTGSYSGDGGMAVYSELDRIVAVSPDGEGGSYLVSMDNSVIDVDMNGIMKTVAGNRKSGYYGDGGPATQAGLYGPEDVATDGKGGFYIADTYNNRIRYVDTNGMIWTIAGNGTQGYSGDGGPATQAELNMPFGVAPDGEGGFYIADSGNYRVRRVDSSGIITTVAGNGSPGFSGDEGPAIDAQFYWLNGVEPDGKGGFYIPDNNRIRDVDSNGIIKTIAGNGWPGYSGDGGPAIQAQLKGPNRAFSNGNGGFFIVDALNNVIREVVNGIITTVAGNGLGGYSGDGGPAKQAKLWNPYDAALDDQGHLIIADTYNQRVREVFLTPLSSNHPPEANDQTFTLDEWQFLYFSIQATDSDGDPLNYIILSHPSLGSLTGSNTSLRYFSGSSGQDSFQYMIFDYYAAKIVNVNINVTPPHPWVESQTVSTLHDKEKAITLFGTSQFPTKMTYQVVTSSSHGTLSGAAPNLVYAPDPGYAGTDSFTFIINDGQVSNQATVSISVINHAPVAESQSVTLLHGSSKTLSLQATDADEDPVTYSIFSPPKHGTLDGIDAVTGAVTYSPDRGYAGSDSFTFKASDGIADGTATVSITITDRASVASEDSYSTPEDTPLAVDAPGVLMNDQDPDGDTLSADLVSGSSHGTLALDADGSFVYSPAKDYNGTDSFTYRASDGVTFSQTATVSVRVTPVDDAPVATDLSVRAFAGQATDFALSATDVDGDPLTYRIVSSPAHGLLSGTPPELSYLPDDGFVGSDSFAFAASDGSLESATTTAMIGVVRPLLTLGGSLTVAAGESVDLPISVMSDVPDVAGLDLKLRATASPASSSTLAPSFDLSDETADWRSVSDPSDPWRFAIVNPTGLAGPVRLLLLTARAPRDAMLGATYRIEATKATVSDSKGSVSDVSEMTAPAKITIAACSDRPKGDLNHDGRVSLGDAILTLRIVVLNESPENVCARAAADVNCDGSIGLGDVILILRNVALSEPFPCG